VYSGVGGLFNCMNGELAEPHFDKLGVPLPPALKAKLDQWQSQGKESMARHEEYGWLCDKSRENVITLPNGETISREYAERPIAEGGLGAVSKGFVLSSKYASKEAEVAIHSVRAPPFDRPPAPMCRPLLFALTTAVLAHRCFTRMCPASPSATASPKATLSRTPRS
jgi:hypothetical protein